MGFLLNRNVFYDIAFSCLFFMSAFLLIFMPFKLNIPVWDSYKILFLPYEANVSVILNEMERYGISGTVCSESIDRRFESLEANGYTDYPFTLKEHYAQWFFNDQEKITYMYIPAANKISEGFIEFLKRNVSFFYLEDYEPFTFLQFSAAGLFFLLCLIITSRKYMFFSLGLPFVFYAGLEKGILSTSSAILSLYSISCWIEAIGGRLKLDNTQIKRRIKKNSFIIVLPILAILLAVFNSRISALLFFLAVSSAAFFFYITENCRFLLKQNKDIKRLHRIIEPYIMNPNSIDKFWTSEKLYTVSGASIIFIFTVSSFLFFRYKDGSSYLDSRQYLPVPAEHCKNSEFSASAYEELLELRSGDSLPDLGNYITDVWFSHTLPYYSVRDFLMPPKKGDCVRFNDFHTDTGGVVTEKEKLIFCFDDAFFEKNMPLRIKASIEDILYKQGRFTTVRYGCVRFPFKRYGKAALVISIFSALMPLSIILLRALKK